MSDELKRKILEIYLENTEKDRTMGNWYHVVAESSGLNKTEFTTECQFLEDEEYLEKIIHRGASNDRDVTLGVRITAKGKKALQTIYNPEWVTQNNKEKQDEEDLRIREIKNAESSHKWTKIGIVIAIILGVTSFIYTTIKP